MPDTLTLWLFQREHVVPESFFSGYPPPYIPTIIEELQKHDPELAATPDTTHVRRIVVGRDDYIPVLGRLQSNLVLVVGVPGNRKLLENMDVIQQNLEHLLKGAFPGSESVDVAIMV